MARTEHPHRTEHRHNTAPATPPIAGVDVGGTFTDFVFLTPDGQIHIHKRPSTPADPAQSLLHGLHEARTAQHLPPGFTLVHGTTVATNALLERRGAPTAFLTTAGFRHLLHIARQNRHRLYTLHPERPQPLLPLHHCYELPERSDYRGTPILPPDTRQATEIIQHLRNAGYQAIAICFLFAHLNPHHERTVGAIAAQHGLYVALSSSIAPEPREYERATTTVASAFVGPIMARYLQHLQQQLHATGATTLRIMHSSGGALSATEAAANPVTTALSGPAGGVVAAAHIGRTAGFSNLITLDMGGTSTDVALLHNAHCPRTTSGTLGDLPLRVPMLDIHTVGAGGGSIAHIDAAGALRVGPRSAGADPGPVACGKGHHLTVTDANLLLQRIPHTTRLAGTLPLDIERVRHHAHRLAAQIKSTPEQTALAILRIANAAMARALRHISIERGHNPAHCTLLAFGGAGGLHACELADALHIPTVLIPPFPGAFSALGLALADVQREYVHPLPLTGPPDWNHPRTAQHFQQLLEQLNHRAAQDMLREGFPPGSWQPQPAIDLRYLGQAFEIQVPCHTENLHATLHAFHNAHRQRYGHADPAQPVEPVALRLTAIAHTKHPPIQPQLPTTPAQPIHHVHTLFETGTATTPLYLRHHLPPRQTIHGPAIILQNDATTLIPPRWSATTDTLGNLILTHGDTP